MVLSEDNLFKKHQELCNKLNLDSETLTDSWVSFQNINKNFILEGEPMHWIGCAIYVSCRTTITPTVGQNVVQGNCVNLTALLRHCNLSLAQFFFNIKSWCDMANVHNDFRRKIDELERTFAVTYNVFREYHPIYQKIFKMPEIMDLEQSKQHRNRKQKPVSCTTTKIFEFCWILFIVNKGKDSMYSNNLVNSFHLLLAVCDWAFKNAFLSNRKDLLNPNFEGLPANWTSSDFETPEKAPCIIPLLCTSDNMITDALYIKEYPFKSLINDLFAKNKLTGNENDDCTGIFDPTVFEKNFKNITNEYETQLLSKGDFDERIFLAEYKRRLLEKQAQSLAVASPRCDGVDKSAESPKAYQFGMVAGQSCLTPLTGRKFLGPKDQTNVTPLVTATESISRLHNLLSGRQAGPSEVLEQLFQSCGKNPTEKVRTILQKLGDKFVQAYTENNSSNEQLEYANRRLQFGITLFYKLIESILQNERAIHSDISAIVDKDLFYECMFACSLEIVIYSYESQRDFPWILNVLEIQSYNFVKVIELIIRSKDQLSRDIIKHLNMIEERIISSLVWRSDSLLWETIENSNLGVPKFEDTALPGHLNNDSNNGSCLRKILNSEQNQSPGPSAIDRFQSPVTNSGIVNRQLFPSVHSGQSLLQKHTHILIKDQNGVTKLIPIVDPETQKQVQSKTTIKQESPPLQITKPKRTGGLSILFRKFYNLAGERMERLCTDSNINDIDMKRKIWTVFEESIIKHRNLMKDRDLDQLLMCAVYIICKLSENPNHRNFTDIMKSYREQPQANSDIYRDVLIKPKRFATIDGKAIEKDEERGDLIKFYNLVYVQVMKSFAVKFANNGQTQNSDVLLSPLPAMRKQLVSPSVQIGKNIFVKPLDSPTIGYGCGKNYNYIFSRSPSKDLKDINKAIKSSNINGKRQLQLGEGDAELPSSKKIADKVSVLMEQRRNQRNDKMV